MSCLVLRSIGFCCDGCIASAIASFAIICIASLAIICIASFAIICIASLAIICIASFAIICIASFAIICIVRFAIIRIASLLSSVKNYPQAATDLYHSYHITILIDKYYRSGYPIAIHPS